MHLWLPIGTYVTIAGLDRDSDTLARGARSLLEAEHFFDDMDWDEDLLHDDGLDDMFSTDICDPNPIEVTQLSMSSIFLYLSKDVSKLNGQL